MGKYSVLMTDTKIKAEVSATERASIQRYTFPAGCKERRVLVDLFAPSEYPHNLQDVQTGDNQTVRVEVQNSGRRAGEEVVQLYLSHKAIDEVAPVVSWPPSRR
ncbi:MAG: hypothetical protein ACI4C3_04920 [Bacteroides sp.]